MNLSVPKKVFILFYSNLVLLHFSGCEKYHKSYFIYVLHSGCANGLQNILEVTNYSKYKEFGRVVLMQMKLAVLLHNNCFH